jgi:hypothetical protein
VIRVQVLHFARDPRRLPHSVQERRDAWGRFPGVRARFVNLAYDFAGRIGGRGFVPDIVVFDSTLLRRRWTDALLQDTLQRLAACKDLPGVRIATPLDEAASPDHLIEILRAGHVSGVLTTCPPQALPTLYPDFMPPLGFRQVFTGYLSDAFVSKVGEPPRLWERAITLGYRGNVPGGDFGADANHKVELTSRLAAEVARYGGRIDVAFGQAASIRRRHEWIRFLKSIRVQPGAEGGYGRVHCGNRPWVHANRPVSDMTLSPRQLEAAACGTALALSQGRYGDLLRPDEHYIPINRSLDGLLEVVRRLEDLQSLQAMVDRTRAFLIGGGLVHERRFVEAGLALAQHGGQGSVAPVRAALQPSAGTGFGGKLLVADWASRSAQPLERLAVRVGQQVRRLAGRHG